MPTAVPDGRQRGSRSDDRRRVRRREAQPGDGHPAVARRQFLVTRRRAADVGALRRRRRPRGARRARRHGLGVTRSFCYWPDFMPEPDRLDEDVVERFADFLDAHVELGMRTIPTFIVGHMSGENWDPAWREGRDLYKDVWLVSRQAWFAARDRPPLRRAPGGRRLAGLERDAAVRRAARRATRSPRGRARRRGGPRDGSGAADLPRRRGVGARGLRRRQRLLAARSRAARRLRRPARLPDAGRPAAPAPHAGVRCELAGELRQARRARGVRRQLRLRVRGERGRVLPAGPAHDTARGRARLDRLEQLRLRRPSPRGSVPPPRLRDAFRPDRPNGRPKEQLHDYGDVRRARRASWPSTAGSPSRATRPSSSPSTSSACCRSPSPAYRQDIARPCSSHTSPPARPTCPSSSCASATASPRRTLYLAPCAKLLTAPGLDRLRELAHGGATVYLSYFAGSTTNQRGPWLPWLDEIFGVTPPPALRPRRSDRGRRGRSSTSSRTSATSPPGTRLSFRVAGEPSARSYLPVDSSAPRSSPSTATAAPPFCGTRSAPADRPLHLPPRAHGGEAPRPTPRAPGVSIRRSPLLQASRVPFASTIRVSSSGCSEPGRPHASVRQLLEDELSLEPLPAGGAVLGDSAWPLSSTRSGSRCFPSTCRCPSPRTRAEPRSRLRR